MQIGQGYLVYGFTRALNSRAGPLRAIHWSTDITSRVTRIDEFTYIVTVTGNSSIVIAPGLRTV